MGMFSPFTLIVDMIGFKSTTLDSLHIQYVYFYFIVMSNLTCICPQYNLSV